MKKSGIFILVFLLLLQWKTVRACDICGCVSAAGYNSILPQFQKSLVSLRYDHREFHHPVTANPMPGASVVQRDIFRTADLYLRYRFHRRWFVSADLPVRFNTRQETQLNNVISGVGDLRAEVTWLPLNTGDSMTRKTRQTLMLSGGVKLNNGRYMQRLENGTMAPLQLQSGTGAYTGWIRAQHIVRIGKTGISADAMYYRNGENELGYKLGDQFGTHLQFFYWWRKGMNQLLLHASGGWEYFAGDTEFDAKKYMSGGQMGVVQPGADLYLGRNIISLSGRIPVMQSLPEGQPMSRPAISVGIARTFQ